MASNVHLYVASYVAILTSALFGYTVGLIGGLIVLPSFLDHFGLSSLPSLALASAQTRIVVIWLFGAFCGVPTGIPICAGRGRRMCLVFSAILYATGASLQLASPSLLIFNIGRFINGMGVGAGTLVGPMYISEISPPSERGMLMSGYQTLLQLSALVGFWGAFTADSIFPRTSNLQWQVLILIQLVPAITLLVGCCVVPETPRFLASKERWQDAAVSLAWLRSESVDDVSEELQDIKAAAKAMLRQQKVSFMTEATQNPIRKRLGVGVGLMIAQNMVGLNALNYYAPVIFMSAGFTSVSSSLLLTGIFGAVKVVSATSFMFVFVRIGGNRFWLKLGSAVCGVSMLILAYSIRTLNSTESPDDRDGLNPLGVISVLMVYIFAFAFGVSLGPISWNVCGEIFPLYINAKCCAITICTQWLFQIVIAGITPRLVASFGWMTYLLYAVFCIMSFVWIIFFVPETRGVAIGEAMDRLFDDKADVRQNENEEGEEVSEATALLYRQSERERRRSSLGAFN